MEILERACKEADCGARVVFHRRGGGGGVSSAWNYVFGVCRLATTIMRPKCTHEPTVEIAHSTLVFLSLKIGSLFSKKSKRGSVLSETVFVVVLRTCSVQPVQPQHELTTHGDCPAGLEQAVWTRYESSVRLCATPPPLPLNPFPSTEK